MEMLRALLVAVLALAALAVHAGSVTVEIAQGKLQGRTAGPDDGIKVFKGIPYALPPVGDWRWRPPRPQPGWDGTRLATEYAPDCVQAAYPEGSFFSRPSRPQSEDCLYLNVWTPTLARDAELPVMVWIHGGGLSRGSGASPWYEGTRLAGRGAVIVTINYRLNAFGFLAHPELSEQSPHGSSGNYGMLDQIAALEWVREHIAAFGGDPERVTIFGESAGSWSVNALMATPLAEGLFQRAIGQSGARFGPMRVLDRRAYGQRSAESFGVRVAQHLDAREVDDLRAASAGRVLRAWRDAEGPDSPIVDGWVFPRHVRAVFEAGEQHDVPVIVGYNADEGTTLVAKPPTTAAGYRERVRAMFGDGADAVLEQYPPADDPRAAFLAAFRDGAFGWEMHTWGRLMANVDAPAWLYHFTRHPPGPRQARLGAYHAAEIRYAFDNAHLFGEALTPTDERLADTMADYWVRFARDGNPNGDGRPHWPAYGKRDHRPLTLGETVEVGAKLPREVMRTFDAIDARRWEGRWRR